MDEGPSIDLLPRSFEKVARETWHTCFQPQQRQLRWRAGRVGGKQKDPSRSSTRRALLKRFRKDPPSHTYIVKFNNYVISTLYIYVWPTLERGEVGPRVEFDNVRLDSTAPRARGGECGARRHPPPRREKRKTEGTGMKGRAVFKPFIL